MKQFRVTEESPVVHAPCGSMRGMEIDGVLTFRGIPYAQAARFCAPQPVRWDGVRDCFVWGHVCPTNEEMGSTLFSIHRYWPSGEDCQNLNVWTKDTAGKKPVMVWIHGGGYSGGSSIDEPVTEGDGLAATGEAVVVSVNHRLNCLGFLDLRGYGYPDSANAGLLDLVAALRWVRENIAAFGGDPDNVTIFGQSGGGGKIMALMQMPMADGLYHRAIIQSGVMKITPNLRRGAEFAEKIAERVGADALATADYTALAAAAEAASKELGVFYMDLFGPHPDGETLLDDYATDGFRPETAKVPVLVGSCIAEMSLFSPMGLKPAQFTAEEKRTMTRAQKLERLRGRFGAHTEAIAAEMERTYPEMDLLYALSVDAMLRPGTLDYAAHRAECGTVYNYLFNYEIPVLEGKLAWHGADLGFTFGTLDHSEVLSAGGAEGRALMERMRDAWLAFAATGCPATPALPEWKPFTAAQRVTMCFDKTCRAAENHDAALLGLLMQAPLF